MGLDIRVWKRVPIAILITGMTVLPLSACGQNNPETYTYAKQLFDAHRPQLEHLVKLIQDCKYVQQIASDPTINVPNILNVNACSNRSTEYRDRIARGLAKLGVLWVTVDWIAHRPDGTVIPHEFSAVSFVLSSHGLAAGPGSGSAIWYTRKPFIDMTGLIPLTPPPYHWVFSKD